MTSIAGSMRSPSAREAYMATSAGSGAGFSTAGTRVASAREAGGCDAGGGTSTGATPSGTHPANTKAPNRSEAQSLAVMINTHSGN